MSYDYACDYGTLGTYCGGNADIDFEKDPDSTTDFAFDWSANLGADVIATSVMSLPDGLTAVSDMLVGNKTAIFVSGGSCGRIYRIINRITTTGGRTYDRTMRILVRQQ